MGTSISRGEEFTRISLLKAFPGAFLCFLGGKNAKIFLLNSLQKSPEFVVPIKLLNQSPRENQECQAIIIGILY